MSTSKKILLIAGASVLLLGLILFLSMTSWYDSAVKLENTTIAQWKNNQNTYDNFWKTVKEVAQVPEQYKEDFKQLLVSETAAKFGPEGSKATMQWFQERQINFDSSMYRKVQDVIESGRQDFKRSQTELLDKQRKVADMTQSYWGGIMAKHYDFPRSLKGEAAPPKDTDGDDKLTVLDYPIVTSARTAKAFATGQDEEVNVFGK
jgi:hypothetical protein